MTDPLPPLALRRSQTKMVWYGASSHKLEYIAQVQDILNLKGYQNGITGINMTAVFLHG